MVEVPQELVTALMIKEAFPFIVLSLSAHPLESFELTGGKSIAINAEQSGVAWNEYICT